MFHTYHSLTTPKDHIYKLVELPDDLLDYIKTEPGKTLQFKAPTGPNNLVLCTDSTTYNVRQMNHSNTVLLMNDMSSNYLQKNLATGDLERKLLGIGMTRYQYELTNCDGFVDTTGIPTYSGTIEKAEKTVADVLADSPISKERFYKSWYDLCGSEVDGYAVILGPDFTTDVLHTLVSILIASGAADGAFSESSLAKSALEQNPKYTPQVVHTVVEKFSTDGKLSNEAVAKWFGIQTLKKCSELPDNEFLLKWKLSLPPFYDAPLDLVLVRGNYCRPYVGRVRHLHGANLSNEISARIKELFQIVKEWDYDEFLPYVEEFIPLTKKPESVILKFARKKRVGKKFVVCPR